MVNLKTFAPLAPPLGRRTFPHRRRTAPTHTPHAGLVSTIRKALPQLRNQNPRRPGAGQTGADASLTGHREVWKSPKHRNPGSRVFPESADTSSLASGGDPAVGRKEMRVSCCYPEIILLLFIFSFFFFFFFPETGVYTRQLQNL